jgi:ATP-dependent helicase/nuclease subunit A
MTRAQDRLYVCGYQDRNAPSDGCWYRLIEAGLASTAETFDFTSPDGALTGTGRRLRNPQTRPVERRTVAPAAPAVVLPEWWGQPTPLEPEPPRPLVPSRDQGDEPPVRAPFDGGSDTKRFRRGRLVHRLLQSLPELPPAQWDAAARGFLARPVHLLSAAEQEAVRNETLAVLAHPEWTPLFGPGSVAEAPIVGRIGTRTISGQIDRLVVTADSVLIVDYKTNRPPPLAVADVAPIYLRQLAAYRAALRDLYPDHRLRCALLWTDGPRLMELPADLLDRHAP